MINRTPLFTTYTTENISFQNLKNNHNNYNVKNINFLKSNNNSEQKIDKMYSFYKYFLNNRDTNIELYNNQLDIIRKHIIQIIQKNTYSTKPIKNNFKRKPINNTNINTNFIYISRNSNNTNNFNKISTKKRNSDLHNSFLKLINDIDTLKKKTTDLYIPFILICLNYQLLLTSLLFMYNNKQNTENLYTSQKKIIKNLSFLLKKKKVILYPYFGILNYCKFLYFGDIPIMICSLVKKKEYAHGVMMYPLSFFFHDIQHAYELYSKKRQFYTKNSLLYSNNILKKIFFILNKLTGSLKKRICFIIFYYLHEKCYMFDKYMFDKLLNVKLYNFYVNKLSFFDYIYKSINKNKSSKYSNKYIKYLYPNLNINSNLNYSSYNNKLTDALSIFIFLYNSDYLLEMNNMNNNTKIGYDITIISKKYIEERYKINLIKIRYEKLYYLDEKYKMLIDYLLSLDFSKLVINSGYVKSKSIIKTINILLIKIKINILFSNCLQILNKHNFYIFYKIIKIYKIKSKIIEIIINIFNNKFIPLHFLIILLLELHKNKNKKLYLKCLTIFNERTDIKNKYDFELFKNINTANTHSKTFSQIRNSNVIL